MDIKKISEFWPAAQMVILPKLQSNGLIPTNFLELTSDVIFAMPGVIDATIAELENPETLKQVQKVMKDHKTIVVRREAAGYIQDIHERLIAASA